MDVNANKKTIYVCSPLAGMIEQNVKKAREFGRFVALQGGVPLAPHVTEMFDDAIPAERELGLAYGIDLLAKADEIWVFGDIISRGMAAEIEYAKMHSIPILHVNAKTFDVNPFIEVEPVQPLDYTSEIEL